VTKAVKGAALSPHVQEQLDVVGL